MSAAPKKPSGVGEVILSALAVVAAAIVVALPNLIVAAAVVGGFALVAGLAMKRGPRAHVPQAWRRSKERPSSTVGRLRVVDLSAKAKH